MGTRPCSPPPWIEGASLHFDFGASHMACFDQLNDGGWDLAEGLLSNALPVLEEHGQMSLLIQERMKGMWSTVTSAGLQ